MTHQSPGGGHHGPTGRRTLATSWVPYNVREVKCGSYGALQDKPSMARSIDFDTHTSAHTNSTHTSPRGALQLPPRQAFCSPRLQRLPSPSWPLPPPPPSGRPHRSVPGCHGRTTIKCGTVKPRQLLKLCDQAFMQGPVDPRHFIITPVSHPHLSKEALECQLLPELRFEPRREVRDGGLGSGSCSGLWPWRIEHRPAMERFERGDPYDRG